MAHNPFTGEERFDFLAHSANAHKCQDLPRRRAEVRNSVQVTHMNGKDPTTWAIPSATQAMPYRDTEGRIATQALQYGMWAPKTAS